mgnify:CR=1 FL=1
MKTLPINLNTFDFFEREYINGKKVLNKCGRDFLYYSLHYYFPDKFNKNINNPLLIDKNKIFGFPVKAGFAWLMIQFFKVPALFKELGLSLSINGKQVKTFGNFVTSIISPNKKSAEEAMREVEKVIDIGSVAGIDISVSLWGLIDHVIFVYGYDENNLYVFDTHKVSGLEYEKVTEDNKYIMKISKDIIKKRWTRFGRIWVVKKESV